MSGFIYGVICASMAIGIAELLVPETAKTRPYLKLIFGLAMLVVIIKPLGALVMELPELGEAIFETETEDDRYAEIADEQLSAAYAEGITAELKKSFSLTDFEVGVAMGDDRTPKRITVTLMGSDIFRNPHKIEEHLSAAFGCECVVIIG